jgi:hypothetical protein
MEAREVFRMLREVQVVLEVGLLESDPSLPSKFNRRYRTYPRRHGGASRRKLLCSRSGSLIVLIQGKGLGMPRIETVEMLLDRHRRSLV